MFKRIYQKQLIIILAVISILSLFYMTRNNASTIRYSGVSKVDISELSPCEAFFENRYIDDFRWKNKLDSLDIKNINQASLTFKTLEMYRSCGEQVLKRHPDLLKRVFPFIKPQLPLAQWPKFQEKGIAMFLQNQEIEDGRRTIRLLRTFTELPIEVFHFGDIPEGTYTEFQVTLINCELFLDPKIISKKGTMGKWMAPLLSSFNDVIVVEPDIALFSYPEVMFGFHEAGTLLFPGRRFTKSKLTSNCQKTFESLVSEFDETSEHRDQNIRDFFFKQNEKSLIDPGVIVANRKNQLIAFAAGFMMAQADQSSKCFDTDKEFYWLGHVFTNSAVIVHDEEPSMVGKVENNKMCSSQLCHTKDGKPVWCNGGLRVCNDAEAWKNPKDAAFWKARGKTPQQVKEYYESLQTLEFALIPNLKYNSWDNSAGLCNGRIFCCDLAGSTRFKYRPGTNQQLERFFKIWFGDD